MKFIEVDRSSFSLTLWQEYKDGQAFRRERVYSVAIGKLGFDTPIGAYFVMAKARNPDWKMPDSPWVKEEDRGRVLTGEDPDNPLKAGFLALTDDGIGIHGTDNIESIGTAASHGCVRMHVADVLDLYGRVGVGCPVLIHD